MFLQLTTSVTSTADNTHCFILCHQDVFLKSCTEVLKSNRLVCNPQKPFYHYKNKQQLPLQISASC